MEEIEVKKYKSEIGLELSIPIGVLLLALGGLMIWNRVWIGLVIILITVIFILHLFSTTYYLIAGDQLRIKSGFFVDMTISIPSITKIRETHNPVSSPALSLHRLEIKYNRFDYVLISPKDRTHFIADLLHVSDQIEVPAVYRRKI